MSDLHPQSFEADRTRFGSLGLDTVSAGFLRILRNQLLQFGFSEFMVIVSISGAEVSRRKSSPGVGCCHIDDLDGVEPRTRRFNSEQGRWIAALHTAPKLLFGRQKEV